MSSERMHMVARKIGSVLKDCRAQVAVETSVVLLATAILLLGSFRIWTWFNQDMVERLNGNANSPGFKATRVDAVNNSQVDGYYQRQPLNIFAGQGQSCTTYTPSAPSGPYDPGEPPTGRDESEVFEQINTLTTEANDLFTQAGPLFYNADLVYYYPDPRWWWPGFGLPPYWVGLDTYQTRIEMKKQAAELNSQAIGKLIELENLRYELNLRGDADSGQAVGASVEELHNDLVQTYTDSQGFFDQAAGHYQEVLNILGRHHVEFDYDAIARPDGALGIEDAADVCYQEGMDKKTSGQWMNPGEEEKAKKPKGGVDVF
jgi:hypothetical protein